MLSSIVALAVLFVLGTNILVLGRQLSESSTHIPITIKGDRNTTSFARTDKKTSVLFAFPESERLYVNDTDDYGTVLLLSDYIARGEISEGRRAASVDESLFLGVKSYSGFLNVNPEKGTNLFFWYFPASGTEHLYDDAESTDDEHTTPLVLWLQGGPGASSLYGLFLENGPFQLKDNNVTIQLNPNSWHKKYSMLYIDQPSGTGFSFSNSGGFCKDVTEVAKQLHLGLKQFFQLFPMVQANPFFVTGESYAGKYIPAIGNEIAEANSRGEGVPINLSGLALGNALTDPRNMLGHAEFFYQFGLVDDSGRQILVELENKLRDAVTTHEFLIEYANINEYFAKISSFSNRYNVLQPKELNPYGFAEFVHQKHIRRAIHVGDNSFDYQNWVVFQQMLDDFPKTAMPLIESLLDKGVRIMYYSGNLDLMVAYPVSVQTYRKMTWSGSHQYLNAVRKPFMVNDVLRGYVKKAKNFVDAMVLNAGHMVPLDQPDAAFALIDRFINNLL